MIQNRGPCGSFFFQGGVGVLVLLPRPAAPTPPRRNTPPRPLALLARRRRRRIRHRALLSLPRQKPTPPRNSAEVTERLLLFVGLCLMTVQIVRTLMAPTHRGFHLLSGHSGQRHSIHQVCMLQLSSTSMHNMMRTRAVRTHLYLLHTRAI